MKRTTKSPAAVKPSRQLAAVADPVHQLQDGNGSRLWDALRAELVGFVNKRVRDEALVEDIVHDVLYKAYVRRDTLRESSKLRPWLYQIARNAIVESYRAKKPSQQLPDEFLVEEKHADRIAERELARCLRPLVSSLPPRYRQAVTLAEFEGLSQREVASKLGLSLSGAKSQVQRGRKMLAAALQDCCRVELDRRGGIAQYECQGGCEPCGD